VLWKDGLQKLPPKSNSRAAEVTEPWGAAPVPEADLAVFRSESAACDPLRYRGSWWEAVVVPWLGSVPPVAIVRLKQLLVPEVLPEEKPLSARKVVPEYPPGEKPPSPR
jgi:hypothetical protein